MYGSSSKTFESCFSCVMILPKTITVPLIDLSWQSSCSVGPFLQEVCIVRPNERENFDKLHTHLLILTSEVVHSMVFYLNLHTRFIRFDEGLIKNMMPAHCLPVTFFVSLHNWIHESILSVSSSVPLLCHSIITTLDSLKGISSCTDLRPFSLVFIAWFL